MSDIKSKAITANSLVDGRVLYLGVDDSWVDKFIGAKLFSTKEVEGALEAANARTDEITGAYAIEISGDGLAGRERLRELIRSRGPTVRLDLGKQALDHVVRPQ